MSLDRAHILELQPELLDEILKRLARIDYNSIHMLAGTCRHLKVRCKDFISRHPQVKYNIRFAGMGSSDEEDYYDDDDDRDYDNFAPDDDLDFLECDVDRLSFGSNYDEALDEFLHGPGGLLEHEEEQDIAS